MGTYDHVLLSLTGKCMVNKYVPSRRREALIDNRTEADWSVRSEPSTSTRKKELATEHVEFCTSTHIVLQTPGNAHGAAGPHFTDGSVRSPLSDHIPWIPESPAILNATTVAVASVTTVLAVFFASNLTKALVNVLKKGTCHHQSSTAAVTIEARKDACTHPRRDTAAKSSRVLPEPKHGGGACLREEDEACRPESGHKALGIGSSNMLRLMSLQWHGIVSWACTRRAEE